MTEMMGYMGVQHIQRQVCTHSYISNIVLSCHTKRVGHTNLARATHRVPTIRARSRPELDGDEGPETNKPLAKVSQFLTLERSLFTRLHVYM